MFPDVPSCFCDILNVSPSSNLVTISKLNLNFCPLGLSIASLNANAFVAAELLYGIITPT